MFEILFLSLFIVLIFVMLFPSTTTASKSSFPSDEDIHLRNMKDASGRFYVDSYKGPHYEGDKWEATVRAEKRKGGYIEFVKEITQGRLESQIDKAYERLAEQWERDNEALLKKGIDPDQYFDELTLGLLDMPDSVKITYSVMGYDRLGETTFYMDVKEKDYEWLQKTEDEEGELASYYISENRPPLHKRIIKAIRENMEEEGLDSDDGMVESYVSSIYHKDYYEDASYYHSNIFADDDDIDYTVTL